MARLVLDEPVSGDVAQGTHGQFDKKSKKKVAVTVNQLMEMQLNSMVRVSPGEWIEEIQTRSLLSIQVCSGQAV